ncbi:tyrosine-type recombinase/integrase [Legionella pneumophila]|uniref:tyrosine-type recombinase/integrase n=1 Tax=Legionella pneumophila TaxID=446 RepID=UPI0005C43016|nr:site-specific integrase [Legionella pneumophila]GAN28632.1 putative prophage phiRv2 integrase [Legionella pneumophila]
MGGTRGSGNTAKTPTGVELRKWKSGKVSLRIQFYYQNVQCRETLKLEPTPSNIKYASRLRSEIINSIERGTFSYADYFPDSKLARRFGHLPTSITIGEMLNEFIEETRRSREYSTYIGYKRICDHHLIPYFGATTIQDLKPAYIRKWIKELNVTAKTVSNLLIPLRAIIEQALNDEYIKTNPLDRIVINKLLDKESSKSDFKVDPFNRDEINAILEAAHHPQIRNLFQFAFFTGLRTSELLALEWQDIDFKRGTVKVSRAMVRKRLKGTKTEAGEREVMLLDPAIQALMEQKQFTFKKGKHVFHNPRTKQEWETDHQIRRTAWIYALENAGVRYRNPYQTRHTFASMMLSAGENIMWVASQMGHVDTEMVMKTYGKWIPDNSLRLGYKPLNNWGTYFEPINPLQPRGSDDGDKNTDKSRSYMVEAAGIEPTTIFYKLLILYSFILSLIFLGRDWVVFPRD